MAGGGRVPKPLRGHAWKRVYGMSDEQRLIRQDVLEEYRAILEDTAAMNGRRQNTNGLFVSINVVFLTALGFLLLSTHLNSWWTAATLVIVTLAIRPLNISWIRTIRVYKTLIDIRHKTLQRVENEFNFVGSLYTQYREVGKTPIIRVETSIAWYFLGFYFALDATVILVTYLLMNQYFPLPSF
jgi:hypothetical protein